MLDCDCPKGCKDVEAAGQAKSAACKLDKSKSCMSKPLLFPAAGLPFASKPGCGERPRACSIKKAIISGAFCLRVKQS